MGKNTRDNPNYKPSPNAEVIGTHPLVISDVKIGEAVRLANQLTLDMIASGELPAPDVNPLLWNGWAMYFTPDDVECNCGCGQRLIDNLLYNMLVEAREKSGIPFNILSWNRCDYWNTHEKGSKGSSHMKGYAVDIAIPDSRIRFKILYALILAGFKRIGVYSWGIHVDVDPDKPAELLWFKS